jgi:hypothetical protein
MRWVRRVKARWKRSMRRGSVSPPSSPGISRREFLRKARDVALLAASASALQSCALMITREHGYDRDFDTRRPDSSIQKVVESFPDSGTLEVEFIKERKPAYWSGRATIAPLRARVLSTIIGRGIPAQPCIRIQSSRGRILVCIRFLRTMISIGLWIGLRGRAIILSPCAPST